jgi:catechol 2,3-dioxygenase-like lactoylglutathione lyase family enzyme
MLGDSDAMATIAVKDLERARKFYEGTLGLKRTGDQQGVLNFKSGKTAVVVYQSQYAGTNRATSATWAVPDVESLAAALKSKGVTFEHYELPGLTRKGDVHMAGKFKGAWFKDPDGNILHILTMG